MWLIMNTNMTLFAMPNSQKLGEKIAKKLKTPLTPVNKIVFADGEMLLSASETVRNKDVFIIASTCKPVNDSIMELLIFVDSLKRASARTITVAMSYYGYARQDRKAAGRQPIAARLIADLLEKAGVTKVISVDLHNPSIQGFFSIPLDDLRGQYILAPEIKKLGNFTVVSPDHGGATRARLLANILSDTAEIAIVDKRRTGPNQAETMGILGNVKGKNCVIIDDMIDTGGTIIKAAKVLKAEGAKKVVIAASHGLFSRGFEAFDSEKDIDQVFITDSIGTVYDLKSKKLKVVSLDAMISKTIKATVESTSVAEIYESYRKKI